MIDEAWSTAHANFLASLSDAEVKALTSRARKLTLRKRAQVFSAGDHANDIFIVVGGCIKLYQLSPGGKEIILWFSFPGEMFGVAEAIRDVQREIFAEANVSSEVLVLSKTDFVDFLRDNPEAAMRAIGILSARVRTLGSSIVDLAADDVESRLIRLLLRFAADGSPDACDMPKINGEVCVNIKVTHSDLANLIGASRQTVTTALATFRQRGLIKLIDRHIHIVDADGLRSFMERKQADLNGQPGA